LALCYRLGAAPNALCLPAPRSPAFADGLWQHTCCELFVAVDAKKYREFNFSPSGEWAVYDFAGYRERIGSPIPVAPQISLAQASDAVDLRVLIPAALLPGGAALQVGLTAVLEAADGSKTYWALAHAAAQPDFHLRQSFALSLKAS
jgi:hypothetical protein